MTWFPPCLHHSPLTSTNLSLSLFQCSTVKLSVDSCHSIIPKMPLSRSKLVFRTSPFIMNSDVLHRAQFGWSDESFQNPSSEPHLGQFKWISQSIQLSSHIARSWHATSQRTHKKTQRAFPDPSVASLIHRQIFSLTRRTFSLTTEA